VLKRSGVKPDLVPKWETMSVLKRLEYRARSHLASAPSSRKMHSKLDLTFSVPSVSLLLLQGVFSPQRESSKSHLVTSELLWLGDHVATISDSALPEIPCTIFAVVRASRVGIKLQRESTPAGSFSAAFDVLTQVLLLILSFLSCYCSDHNCR
jgi:hypothetical protein